VHPIVAILGPRQCGKTNLAREYLKRFVPSPIENYFDLEDPEDLARLENPKIALLQLSGLVVIDEIQLAPEIFPILRMLVDREGNNLQILILGSASRELIKQSSESLAGRIGYIELTPFAIDELTDLDDLRRLWFRGGFPRSFLATEDTESVLWCKNYIKTFLERDLFMFGFNISPQEMRKFWLMLTAYHGNIFNASELGKSLQKNYKTMQNYVEILQNTFMVRILHPWYENITKRQVKSPKIYFRDSGIFHTLLGLNTKAEIITHPKLGASWEGFAIEEIIRHYNVDNEDCYFWGLQNSAELDLLIFKNGKRIGFEIKYMDAPRLNKSMQKAIELLKLDMLYIVYPGDKTALLMDQIYLQSLQHLTNLL
jgi:predicted AAA+ superfamily ATPase